MFKLTLQLTDKKSFEIFSSNISFLIKISQFLIFYFKITRTDNEFPIKTDSIYVDLFEEGSIIVRELT